MARQRNFTKGLRVKSLDEVLGKLLQRQKINNQLIEGIGKELAYLRKKNRFNFQKLGLVRFNPFSDLGGDQSFSLAVLDEDSSGVVLTGLHSRESTRVYAKLIEKGNAEKAKLSREEAQAIKKAIEFGGKKK